MSKIRDIGEVIAVREMSFVYDDGRKERAFLKVGKPFENDGDLDWCCPYELSTESHKKVFGMIGIDSLQAIELTMKTLSAEIKHWENSKKGRFLFLDEEGALI